MWYPMYMVEEWKDIVGYEGSYEVSSLGRVRTVERTAVRSNGRPHHVKSIIRKTVTMPKGHLSVRLIKNGKNRTHTVHSLVLTAFTGPRPVGAVCRHLNGVPDDNRLENLAWGSGSDNQLDAVRHGAHHLASRESCLHGHLLEPPNLVPNKGGRRVCRACTRERDDARHSMRPFSPLKANARYEDVLAGRRRHKSEMRF